jgi:excinuclease ABC subunit C
MSDIKKIISKIPNKPGVYKYLDQEGEVIYAGKAKDLKKRVKSYFQNNKEHGPKTKVLVSKIEDIEYIVVDSELEAIMLETNIIKELKPKYNVLMKDDKNFVYIKITTNEKFPKIYLTRKIQKDKATYFGPKTSGYDIKNTVKLISSILAYPKCQMNVEWQKLDSISSNSRKKPLCVFKQIDPDHKPCISDLDENEYNEIIDIVCEFFKGKHQKIMSLLQTKMQDYAQEKEFEKAAILRDRLNSLVRVVEKQKISGTTHDNLDVIDIIFSQNQYFANLFQVREGKLISQNNFILPATGLSEEISTAMQEIFITFLQQYYCDSPEIPKIVLIPEPLENKASLEAWLSNLKDQKVTIDIPQAGRKHDLIKLATKNAEQYAKLMKVKWMSEEARSSQNVLPEIKKILDLKKNPVRIECYDISHLQGNNTVGSMVVFENGAAKKTDYRYFNIKELKTGEINDFQSLQEVLKRRLKYIAEIPEELVLKKKNNIYSLINKKDKKILLQIPFEINETNTVLSLNEQEIKKSEIEFQLLETCLKKIIQKLKAKRYLLKSENAELIELCEKVGFIKIDNKEFNLGYYPQKQVYDSSFTSKPDLIIIDGGKGQLSSALKSKKLYNLKIPFISIAKKQEEIFKEDKTRILLPYNSPMLNLIQQLRDESHRFAITKNRKDRIKNMLKS